MGGAQVYIINLIVSIEDKYEIVLICPDGYLAENIRKKTNSVKIINEDISIKNIIRLRRVLKREVNEDCVINAHLLGTGFYSRVAAYGLTNRLIITLHQPIIYNNISRIKKFTYPIIIKYISKRVNEFIAVSIEIKESLKEYTDKKCVYIANSIPDINPKKIIKGIKEKESVKIGIIGRLSPPKNQFLFLDAAKIIAESFNNSEFYVIGDGKLRNQLETKARNLNISNHVTFVGAVNNPFDWMRLLDVLVFSSDFEGIPLTMLESMSIGLPIVSTDIGGVPDIIKHGENGMLTHAGDAKGLAENILKLCLDDELYIKLQTNGIMYMRTELSYDVNILKYEEVLNG